MKSLSGFCLEGAEGSGGLAAAQTAGRKGRSRGDACLTLERNAFPVKLPLEQTCPTRFLINEVQTVVVPPVALAATPPRRC